ncbi:hypothetical protein C8Q73DRAFT_680467 [Cubamyces lactineus]|nr:hypothetical protein C8Q73DRAFT_680467 [Cubamyces lactineus]
MGKWTLEHHDEVLRNKIKSLVQGAVKRMNAEQETATISYETFVEELDEGDSFTTSLIDVLVKEMAERRTRPNPLDRRLISERTAKTLRMQAAPLHIYRGPSSLRDRSRRGFPVLPPRSYNTFRDILSESDGEDEYGTVLGASGPLEGARINTDLYDAYFPSTDDLPGSLSRRTEPAPFPSPPHTLPTEPTGAWLPSGPPTQPPPSARSVWPTSTSGSGASLTRQSSIRRLPRPRSVLADFAEFTARRRSTIRNSNTQEDGPRADSSSEPTGRSIASGTRRGTESYSTTDPMFAYYPMSPWSSARRRSMPSTSSSTGGNARSTATAAAEDSAHDPSGSRSPSSSQLWYSLTSTPPSTETAAPVAGSSASAADGASERPQVVAPRLRRGGLRPPESLLTHQIDDAPANATSSGHEASDSLPPVSSLDTMVSDPPSSGHYDIAGLSSVPTLPHSPEPPAVDSR